MTTPASPAITFEGQIADAILAAIQKNQTAIVAAINGAEGGLSAFLTAELNSVKIGNVFEQALFDAVKPAIVAELIALENANNGTVIYSWAISQALGWAKQLGG